MSSTHHRTIAPSIALSHAPSHHRTVAPSHRYPVGVLGGCRHPFAELRVDRGHELLRCQKRMVGTNQHREVFRHPARFHDVDAHTFERLCEPDNVRSVVEPAAILQSPRPGID